MEPLLVPRARQMTGAGDQRTRSGGEIAGRTCCYSCGTAKPGGTRCWRVEARRRQRVKVQRRPPPAEYACEQEKRHDFGAIFLSPTCAADPRVGHCRLACLISEAHLRAWLAGAKSTLSPDSSETKLGFVSSQLGWLQRPRARSSYLRPSSVFSPPGLGRYLPPPPPRSSSPRRVPWFSPSPSPFREIACWDPMEPSPSPSAGTIRDILSPSTATRRRQPPCPRPGDAA